MKKIILLDSSYPINSRNTRLLKTLAKVYRVKYITWNRDNSKIQEDGFESEIFTKKAEYGNKFKKLINIFEYYKFISKVIKKESPNIIIASHWEMLFIAKLLKSKYKFKIVYENLDMPDSKYPIIQKIIKYIEKKGIKNTEGTIFASRFFTEFYHLDKTLVFENYVAEESQKKFKKTNNNIHTQKKIAFIGNIRHYEILKNLIKAAFNKNVKLDFYGSGLAEEKLKEFCFNESINTVTFHGKYNYSELREIYSEIQVVWAAYPNKSFNVKYAISNKFFEVLHYKKIGIFSSGTKLSELVSRNKIGLVVDPYSVTSIEECIEKVTNENISSEIKKNINDFSLKENIQWSENENRLLDFFKEI